MFRNKPWLGVMKSVSIRLFYFIFATIEGYRKYDVEEESRRLYGRSIASVMAGFRRSTDYVNILEDKLNALKIELKDVSHRTVNYYDAKMKSKIMEITGVNSETTDIIEERNIHLSFRRHNIMNATEWEQLQNIERIDDYFKYYSFLTLKERNRFKDLGFEYTKVCIHSLIKNMGDRISLRGHTHMTTTNDHDDDDADIKELMDAIAGITENTNFNIGL